MSGSLDDGLDPKGGSASYAGWEFQADVSVWVAVELLLIERVARLVRLEPGSEEDIEVDFINRRGDEPSQLVVQVKLRASGALGPVGLKTLMTAGGVNRDSPLEQLADLNKRFLLITSQAVTGGINDFVINKLLHVAPAKSPQFSSTFGSEAKTVAGRFGLFANLNVATLADKLKLLFISLQVPQSNVEKLQMALRQQAQAHIKHGGPWYRKDLEEQIKDAGGSIPGRDNEFFVRPSGWNDMVERLSTLRKLILTGPSGTGKTATARALEKVLLDEFEGLQVSTHLPEADHDWTYRWLFQIEDPWGKYSVDASKSDLGSRVLDAMRARHANAIYLVTTRSDILAEAGVDRKHVAPYMVAINSDDYSRRDLEKFYAHHAGQLREGRLRLLAEKEREFVLDQTSTPFELLHFFGHLAEEGIKTDANRGLTREAIEAVLSTSIESQVKARVKALGAQISAAAVWAWLAGFGNLLPQDVSSLGTSLESLGAEKIDELERFLDVMVAGQFLRKPDDVLTYYHPRVQKGFELALGPVKAEVAGAIRLVLDSLCARLPVEKADAVTIIKIAHALKKQPFGAKAISHDAQTYIDNWCEWAPISLSPNFVETLDLIQSVGSEASVCAEVARWLTNRVRKGGWGPSWVKPQKSESWYEAARQHSPAEVLCTRFIREVFIKERAWYRPSFYFEMKEVSPNLADAWRDAALEGLAGEPIHQDLAVAEAVMNEPHLREDMLRRALVQLAQASHDGTEEERMAWEDGHYSESDDPGDDPYFFARSLVSAYVSTTRLYPEGWRLLPAHPQLREIQGYWLRQLANIELDEALDPEEFDAAMSLVKDSIDEADGWSIIGRRGMATYWAWAKQCLSQTADFSTTTRACAVAVGKVYPNELVNHLNELLRAGITTKATQLIFVLADSHKSPADSRDRLEAVFGEVQGDHASLGQYLLHSDEKSMPPPPNVVALAKAEVLIHTGDVQVHLLRIAAADGRGEKALISQRLRDTLDPEIGKELVEAAASCNAWDVVEAAVGHRRADVRQRAFEKLVAKERTVHTRFFSLSADYGSRVRRALVTALSEYPSPRMREPIIQLCSDSWVDGNEWHGDAEYGIARAASKVLFTCEAPETEQQQELCQLALTTSDHSLCVNVVACLGQWGDPRILSQLRAIAFEGKDSKLAYHVVLGLVYCDEANAVSAVLDYPKNWLKRGPGDQVALVCQRAGMSAPRETVVRMANELGPNEFRRVFVLLIALGLGDRDAELTEIVLDSIPHGHVARDITRLCEESSELPASTLDNLGHIRYVNLVAPSFPGIVKRDTKPTFG